MESLVSKYESVLRWVFDRSPPLSFLTLFLFGCLIVLASAAVGVFSFERLLPSGASKQVGYFWALNWSFMMLLGFPVMMFFMQETADSLRHALERLAANSMIVDAEWRPAPLSTLDGERSRFWHNSAAVSLLLLVVLMTYCAWEWYRVSGQYLIANRSPLPAGGTDWIDELDWSVAAILGDPRNSSVAFRLVNGVFSLVNYFVLGVYLTVVFTYYAMLIMYADLFRRLSQARNPERARIIPDVDEEDPRRGFGLFEPVFRRALVATMIGFVMCFFMNLQNAYLRDDAPDILSFSAPQLTTGWGLIAGGDVIRGLGEISGQLFKAPHLFNLTTAWAIVLVFSFFSLVALALAWTLSQAAERGRDDLRDHLRDATSPIHLLTNLDREHALTRLGQWNPESKTGMVIWPFGWPGIRQLVIFLVFGAACTMLYKLGLFYAGAAIFWIVVSMLKGSN